MSQDPTEKHVIEVGILNKNYIINLLLFLSLHNLMYAIRCIYIIYVTSHYILQRENDEGPMLETLDHTIRIGSTPTFLYFDLYLYSAYAAHYIYVHLILE